MLLNGSEKEDPFPTQSKLGRSRGLVFVLIYRFPSLTSSRRRPDPRPLVTGICPQSSAITGSQDSSSEDTGSLTSQPSPFLSFTLSRWVEFQDWNRLFLIMKTWEFGLFIDDFFISSYDLVLEHLVFILWYGCQGFGCLFF